MSSIEKNPPDQWRPAEIDELKRCWARLPDWFPAVENPGNEKNEDEHSNNGGRYCSGNESQGAPPKADEEDTDASKSQANPEG